MAKRRGGRGGGLLAAIGLEPGVEAGSQEGRGGRRRTTRSRASSGRKTSARKSSSRRRSRRSS